MKHYKEEHLLSVLHSFRTLEHGWEGYNQAKPIQEESIQNAEVLLKVLLPHFPDIELFPLIDGFIQIESKNDFEIEIYPDYYCVVLFGNASSYAFIQVDIGKGDEVLRVLVEESFQ